MKLTDEQVIEIYHIIFSKVHSDGFMISEVKDVLFDPAYYFLEYPNPLWYPNLIQYLNKIGLNLSDFNMNTELIPYISHWN